MAEWVESGFVHTVPILGFRENALKGLKHQQLVTILGEDRKAAFDRLHEGGLDKLSAAVLAWC